MEVTLFCIVKVDSKNFIFNNFMRYDNNNDKIEFIF